MKKASILILMSLCLLAANEAFTQNLYSDIFSKMAIKVAPQEEQTNIKWNTATKYDFGEIQQGEAITYEFQFTNVSTKSIHIYNINTAGICIAPAWENKAILPNETGTIKVTFCAGTAGEFKNIIKVHIRDTEKAETLYIAGQVVS